MSLTCGPLKVVILATQKAFKLRYCFDSNLIDFEDDGDKQCIEINALFSEELMLFQQFCCSGVGRYQQVQTHLCIRATTFYALPVPLPRQFIFRFKWGSENDVENSVEKVSPKGPQMDPKSCQKST